MQWLLIVLPVLGLVVFRYRRRRLYKLASLRPPLDDDQPVIGSALKLCGSTEEIMIALKRFSYDSMKHNGIVRCWLGHILYFVVVNPVDVEMVLKTCLEKDNLHRFMWKVFGYAEIFAPASGQTLPAGSGVAVSIWGVHQDAHYWGPDAEHFDPDRFLPERFNLAHACNKPFSNGPRHCVGVVDSSCGDTCSLATYNYIDHSSRRNHQPSCMEFLQP